MKKYLCLAIAAFALITMSCNNSEKLDETKIDSVNVKIEVVKDTLPIDTVNTKVVAASEKKVATSEKKVVTK